MSDYISKKKLISHIEAEYKSFGEDYDALQILGDIEDFQTEERPHEKWEYLKEHITEMRDADGELNQKQTCHFILELMGVIEREGEAE